MKKYLVTGGAGFIGSHIVDALLEKGAQVRVIDNFSSGKMSNLAFARDKIDLLKADIRSKKDCLKATRGMDCVLHQAALRSVPKSFNNPKEYNEVNIQGILNMLEAAVENKVKTFVFASSSSVYGDVKEFPESEDFTPAPISPYALTKLTGEHYCKVFSLRYGLSTVALRYFNVFGPRQSLDDEYAVVIPKFIDCMLKNKRPPIYGTGKQSRDFTYVDNVVNANILASLKKNSKGDVFNVASGRDYSILELVSILNKLTRNKIKPVFLDKRPGDVFRTAAGLSNIKKVLGYKAKIDFIQGLKITLEYFTCVKK
ncbi:MAG: SDR family oxidoreductase [Candidatus Omnitrophica bacterium]|nr:SDR family oxidoreductase [Candidatus Omnitrophota bacterium]